MALSVGFLHDGRELGRGWRDSSVEGGVNWVLHPDFPLTIPCFASGVVVVITFILVDDKSLEEGGWSRGGYEEVSSRRRGEK